MDFVLEELSKWWRHWTRT